MIMLAAILTVSIILPGRDAIAWDDVVAASDTNKWATAKRAAGGAVGLTAPVQFGIDDASTHAFLDTNQVILWENQEYAPADLYGFTVLGAASGTNNVTAGIKTGTGSAATGKAASSAGATGD